MNRKKVLQINGGSSGSTGTIMFGIKENAKKKGYEVICASPVTRMNKGKTDFKPIGTYHGRRVSVLLSRITGLSGCFSMCSTFSILKYLDEFEPSIIHLHNLHDSYLNLPILFKYIKKREIPVVWTLHDCWAFTGHCPHFIYERCYKWKKGCYKCPRYKSYPISYFDNSKLMWKLKKKWFTGVSNLKIVTPSRWLASLVKQSFLCEYDVTVINNGINIEVFKNRSSTYFKKMGLTNKKIILGVSYVWDEKKGLDVFIKLSKTLPAEYQVVLVGTSEEIDEKLPPNIVSIHRTHNQNELAEIYASADVFINPTREDNFPTVNLEAIACGTPVITYNSGGASETVDEYCGIVIDVDDVDALQLAIIETCETKCFDREIVAAHSAYFDEDRKYKEYMYLYENIKN